MVNLNVAPDPGLLSTRISPLWAKIISRLIYRPRPIPLISLALIPRSNEISYFWPYFYAFLSHCLGIFALTDNRNVAVIVKVDQIFSPEEARRVSVVKDVTENSFEFQNPNQ